MDQQSPIRIVVRKKKAGHGGHHGGAWKVAYADFVTAMMALFIVLWIVGQSQNVKKAVVGYFTDPTGYMDKVAAARAGQSGSGGGTLGAPQSVPQTQKVSIIKEKEVLQATALKIKELIAQVPQFQRLKDNIVIELTDEGLRIQLIETEKGMFFAAGSPTPDPTAVQLLGALARELSQMENSLVIEGHTDSHPYVSNTGYSNWELSTDRANNARRIMEENGLAPGQVSEVRGYADRKLRYSDPYDPRNRRISIIVKYADQPEPPKREP